MTYQSEVLADSPTEFWKLDEASGSTVASAGSGAHSGTASGTTVVAGIDGNARSFNGTSDTISAANVADFTAQTNYTFEAWFKTTTSDTSGTDWRTISRRDSAGAWLVRVAGSTSGIQQGAVQAYLQGRTISTGSTRFDDGNWHHVVVTKAGSTYKLYVDKVEYTTAAGTVGGAIGTTQPIWFGSNNGATGEFYKGSIDAIAIYHSALSTTRIDAHYNAAMPFGVTVDVPTTTLSAQAQDVTVETPLNLSGYTPTNVPITADGTSWAGDGGAATSGSGVSGYFRHAPITSSDAVGTGFSFWVAKTGTVNVYPVLNSAGTTLGAAETLSSSGTNQLTLNRLVGPGETIYGWLVSVGTGTLYFSEHATNKPSVTAYNYVVTNVTVDVDSPAATLNAAEPTVVSIATANAVVDVSSAAVTLTAPDTSFESTGTATVYPTSDDHRAAQSLTFVNDPSYMEIAYNPAQNASPVFNPSGTASEIKSINDAIRRIDFPLESLSTALNAQYGRPYVNVSFIELGTGESNGGLLGEFRTAEGLIYLDLSLIGDQDRINMTMAHEIGHVVDHFYLTNAMRVRVWNMWHPTAPLPPTYVINNSVEVADGEGWLGYGDYFTRVGEAFASGFAKAYSDATIPVNQFTHPVTESIGTTIRGILTPTQSLVKSLFPVRTPIARMFFPALPGEAVSGTVVTATLRLNVELSSGSGNYIVELLNEAGGVEGTKTVALSLGGNNIDITNIYNPKTVKNVRVSAEVAGSSRTVRISSMDDANTATEPRLTVKYVVAQGATVVDLDAPVITSSASDVTVDVQVLPNAAVDVDAAAMTVAAPEAVFAQGVTVDVDAATVGVGVTEPDVMNAENVDILVDKPKLTVRAWTPAEVQGEPIVPTEDEDPYFVSTWSTFAGARTYSGAASSAGAALGPETAFWYRFDERSGTTASDRAWVYRNAAGDIVSSPGVVSGKSADLQLHDVVIGLNNGPEGRANFAFTGNSYISSPGGAINQPPTSLEFTFKTDRPTQFIMGGAWAGAGTTNNPPMPPWELWMVDGVLEVRQYAFDNDSVYGNSPYTVTKMRTNLADNEWHHVVIQRANLSIDERGIGAERFFMFEAYVDSHLELRRRVGNLPMNFPQFIGGRTNAFYHVGQYDIDAGNLSNEQWFKGEMTELVFRVGDTLSEDEVAVQRDNVMSIDVFHADAPKIVFSTADVTVKGNKPRVLVLDFGPTYPGKQYSGEEVNNRISNIPVGSAATSIYNQMLFPEQKLTYIQADFPGYGESETPYYSSVQTGATQWFRYDVRQKPNADGGETNVDYRDEITDNYRLIDLEKDLNMDDFDIISIIGFPRNNYMWQRYEDMDFKNLPPMIPAKVQIENLLAQVRDQVVNHRKNLYVTDPFSAAALGIIDDFEGVPRFKETYVYDQRIGGNTGGLDWHAFITDPFNAPDGIAKRPEDRGYDPHEWNKTNLERAAHYEDAHANLKQQVRSIVNGLTTGPYGWIKTDDIVWWALNPMSSPPFQRSIRYEDKTLGLDIGDQFYLAQDHIQDSGYIKGAGNMLHTNGYVAAPMSAIKVGKAVTSFAPVFYATGLTNVGADGEAVYAIDEDKAIGNNYGDYAVSIAVEPGDVWNGDYVTGKVYVNFTEGNVWNPEQGQSSYIMQLRSRFPDVDLDYTIYPGKTVRTGQARTFVVSPEQMRYQWSTHFGSYQGSEIPLPAGGKQSDWGWSTGGTRQTGGFSTYGAGEAMSWGWQPAVPLEVIPTPPMYHKGFLWLLSDIDTGGNVNASVDAANATANANDVTVETTQSAVVDVPAARISVESFNDADTVSPDVTIGVSAPEIAVQAKGLTEYIDVDSATIVLQANELDPGAIEINWEQALVFVMPRQYLTLTMEEA